MPRLIVGHTTDKTCKIWVRGSRRWPFAFVDVLSLDNTKAMRTRTVELEEEEFFTSSISCRGFTPNTDYKVKVSFGKKRNTPEADRVKEAYTNGKFRTFGKKTANINFLFGSCNLHSLGVFNKPDKAWLTISEVARSTNANFMLHCGDQIYSDIPLPARPNYGHYRRKYLDAWKDCKPAQRALTELPHYMILDDHEITNNFDHDTSDDNEEALLNVAMKVYYEFQHKHNPDTPATQPRRYYYWFSCGGSEFFVLDTRYNRHSRNGTMIDVNQLAALKRWLTKHRTRMKFVVTSVPFVGQVRYPKNDKWCDPVFEDQREEILNHVLDKQIEKLTFLTGDMHSSYHARMKVSNGSSDATIHELMSSPINQVTPTTHVSKKFEPVFNGEVGALEIYSEIDPNSFYGDHSNIMSVSVTGNEVRYRISRTTEKEQGPSGSYIP